MPDPSWPPRVLMIVRPLTPLNDLVRSLSDLTLPATSTELSIVCVWCQHRGLSTSSCENALNWRQLCCIITIIADIMLHSRHHCNTSFGRLHVTPPHVALSPSLQTLVALSPSLQSLFLAIIATELLENQRQHVGSQPL